MPGLKNDIYLHLIWSTWERLPTLTEERKQLACDEIIRRAAEHQCAIVATNGVMDHVHVLLRLTTNISISSLVHDLKVATSHRINVATGGTFRWQGEYAVFPVAPAALERVTSYICNQEEHHREKTLNPLLESSPP